MDDFESLLHSPDLCPVLLLAGVAYVVVRRVAGLSTGHPWLTRLGFLAFGGAFVYCHLHLQKELVTSLAAGCGALVVLWLVVPLWQMQERARATASRWRDERRTPAVQSEPAPSRPPPAPDPALAQRRRREELDARRRSNARFEAETLYRRYFAAVKDAFPPEAFEAYLNKYMVDGESAEVIEQRLEKFKASLLELAGARPGRRGDPKDALLAEYQKQVAWIKDAPFEPEVKESMRIEAERRFYERMMEMMGPEV